MLQYKIIWNDPNEFKDVMHVRNFHPLMHFFSNCGKFVTNNEFEEIVHQARMCSVGGLKPALSVISYNLCWRIHV